MFGRPSDPRLRIALRDFYAIMATARPSTRAASGDDDYWRRNGMSRNEAANRCPDGAVVGGDPAVIAVQEGVDRLPGVVDAAGKIWRCHAGPGQVIL